jgi:hypothetical protein
MDQMDSGLQEKLEMELEMFGDLLQVLIFLENMFYK